MKELTGAEWAAGRAETTTTTERDALAARLAAVEALIEKRQQLHAGSMFMDFVTIRDLRAALAAPTDTEESR